MDDRVSSALSLIAVSCCPTFLPISQTSQVGQSALLITFRLPHRPVVKTSSSIASTPPRTALARENLRGTPRRRSASRSPALSSASTAEEAEDSPNLPPLPAPRLSEQVLGLLRTPPPRSDRGANARRQEFLGSPYPSHLRGRSLSSSEPSQDSPPIHRLDIFTPALRPAPVSCGSPASERGQPLSAAAAVLAHRARHPALGITEDWIRQHTTGDREAEPRHWLSDGTGGSENSSLSGSLSGDDAAWLRDHPLRTPRADSNHPSWRRLVSPRHLRHQSSSETLTQANHDRSFARHLDNMATPDLEDGASHGDMSEHVRQSSLEPPSTPKRDQFDGPNGSVNPGQGLPTMETTARTPARKEPFKRKVPWQGKNIIVALPLDEERGQPGKAPVPLGQATVDRMYRSWGQLGYDPRGFDLDISSSYSMPGEYSQSRSQWPDPDHLARDRSQHRYKVLLPDLNGKPGSMRNCGLHQALTVVQHGRNMLMS